MPYLVFVYESERLSFKEYTFLFLFLKQKFSGYRKKMLEFGHIIQIHAGGNQFIRQIMLSCSCCHGHMANIVKTEERL